ncbi:1-alkyl-2-acetylglycerophosphocholine esterase [Klebsormidium nitens]|uniref:1-alkyl-2-acetylglycerophosphocholine esterase n=1 Tax=Klebsormidium nitens TaxID=105231 RepID=A0A1Y1HYI2_KLENI|nr:1-alkyl-2-acetylglycerophosphocholine esterase [Klebsormidium nitens]|eukprot:GAQ82249.1 1-alkyl-2-acetylglycerophosphocholine esterase [Klebsormidium nitens]
MGFPPLLGPYKVAFADFELRPGAKLPKREVPVESDYVFVPHEGDVGQEYVDIQEGGSDRSPSPDQDLEANADKGRSPVRTLLSQTSFEEDQMRHESESHQRSVRASEGKARPAGEKLASVPGEQKGPAEKGESIPPPLVRFWYPTQEKANGSWFLRRWLPGFMYALGFANVVLWQKTFVKRTLMYMAGAIFHLYAYGISLPAYAGLQPASEDKSAKGKFPVVIFSHGLFAMRTTYSAFCCDLASYGYVVISLEHRDGTASASRYAEVDAEGRITHKYQFLTHLGYGKDAMEVRHRQLLHRVAEVRATLDLATALDSGLVSLADNVAGTTTFDPAWFKGKLDLSRVSATGHSFGAATAVTTCGLDSRFKACVALDCWWEPFGEEEYRRAAGKAPVISVHSEAFEWANLRACRERFTAAKRKAGGAIELLTIRGTKHTNQSDFALVATGWLKLLGKQSDVDPVRVQGVSSRAGLQWIQSNEGIDDGGVVHRCKVVAEDSELLIHGERSEAAPAARAKGS